MAVSLIPKMLLKDAVNKTLKQYPGYCSDGWGEEERAFCRRQCGPSYSHIETDLIHRLATNLRKAGKVESINGGPKRKKWKEPEGKYKEYLDSEHWQSFRKLVMEFWSWKCCVCPQPAKDVHHNTYLRVGQEELTDCVALCRQCHKKVHGAMEDGDEYFNSPEEGLFA